MASTPGPSPGNAYAINLDTPPMRLPSLTFIYRMECEIAPQELHVGAPYNNGVIRSIAPITGGSVRGPRIDAEVLSIGGADWAQVQRGTHSMRLEAKYLLRTKDGGHHILVNSNGLYRPGPGTEYARRQQEEPDMPPLGTVTQDDVEFFTHVSFEAGGDGPYNWLNGLVCVGVLECVDTRIVLDCYCLTNFPDRQPESVLVR